MAIAESTQHKLPKHVCPAKAVIDHTIVSSHCSPQIWPWTLHSIQLALATA